MWLQCLLPIYLILFKSKRVIISVFICKSWESHTSSKFILNLALHVFHYFLLYNAWDSLILCFLFMFFCVEIQWSFTSCCIYLLFPFLSLKSLNHSRYSWSLKQVSLVCLALWQWLQNLFSFSLLENYPLLNSELFLGSFTLMVVLLKSWLFPILWTSFCFSTLRTMEYMPYWCWANAP